MRALPVPAPLLAVPAPLLAAAAAAAAAACTVSAVLGWRAGSGGGAFLGDSGGDIDEDVTSEVPKDGCC